MSWVVVVETVWASALRQQQKLITISFKNFSFWPAWGIKVSYIFYFTLYTCLSFGEKKPWVKVECEKILQWRWFVDLLSWFYIEIISQPLSLWNLRCTGSRAIVGVFHFWPDVFTMHFCRQDCRNFQLAWSIGVSLHESSSGNKWTYCFHLKLYNVNCICIFLSTIELLFFTETTLQLCNISGIFQVLFIDIFIGITSTQLKAEFLFYPYIRPGIYSWF